ncbi:hypothetical protein ACP70R_042118 [Stipagrostis hirtigluma subsp. patula]
MQSAYIASSVGIFLWVCGTYKPVMAPPASDLGRSTGDAGDDDIVAQTSDESEKSFVVASDAAISSGVQSGPCFSVPGRVMMWANVIRLDGSAWGQPIGQVMEHVSWEVCSDHPIKQRIKGTSALLACTMAEATHRLLDDYLSKGTYPWIAAEPHNLLDMCRRKGEAFVRGVLQKISNQHGVPVVNGQLSEEQTKPLVRWWREQGGGDHGLSPHRMAKLLRRGLCVGTLWACPWYYLSDVSRKDAVVYRSGCGRSQAARAESKRLHGHKVGPRTVLCLAYRRCGDQMHVLVWDNHSDAGILLWVDIEELYTLYALGVPEPTFEALGMLKPGITTQINWSPPAWRLFRSILRGGSMWPNKFQLRLWKVGKPIGRSVRSKIWEVCRPIKQRKKATCALVACAVAVEAMHRRRGRGRLFPVAEAEAHKQLLEECQSKGIWTPDKGAYVGDVLKMIRELGGVPTTNRGQRLPLPWSQKHTVAGLSSDSVAKLLDDNGPCVGTLWTCPWYYYFFATSHNDVLVYQGCGRSEDYRKEGKDLYPGEVGSHAVVCIGYRLCGNQMHLLVLDNYTDIGPRRWVDVEEFDELHTVSMEGPSS